MDGGAIGDVTPDSGSMVTDAGQDSGKDASVSSLINSAWVSPNGATFERTATNRLRITAASTFNHAMISPAPMPSGVQADYEVDATVLSGAAVGEFGLILRQQSDTAVVVGSLWGTSNRPFITLLDGSWEPVPQPVLAPPQTLSPNTRYRMKVEAIGSTARFKLWPASAVEPAGFNAETPLPWSTGVGVGFYVYGAFDAELEDFVVTSR